MNFSIPEIICHLLAPWHELSCSWRLWRRLLAGLRERGLDGCRESGAFLLGRRCRGKARIVSYILYDDLDVEALATGIVRFDGRYFSDLWSFCKAHELVVVADVHTHPGGSQQSDSDRAHPMITRAGHIALILPLFASAPVHRPDIGIYRYEGSGRWYTVPRHLRRRFLHIGL